MKKIIPELKQAIATLHALQLSQETLITALIGERPEPNTKEVIIECLFKELHKPAPCVETVEFYINELKAETLKN